MIRFVIEKFPDGEISFDGGGEYGEFLAEISFSLFPGDTRLVEGLGYDAFSSWLNENPGVCIVDVEDQTITPVPLEADPFFTADPES